MRARGVMIGALLTAADQEAIMTQLAQSTTSSDRNLDPDLCRDRARNLRCQYVSRLAGRAARAMRTGIALLARQIDRRLHHV